MLPNSLIAWSTTYTVVVHCSKSVSGTATRHTFSRYVHNGIWFIQCGVCRPLFTEKRTTNASSSRDLSVNSKRFVGMLRKCRTAVQHLSIEPGNSLAFWTSRWWFQQLQGLREEVQEFGATGSRCLLFWIGSRYVVRTSDVVWCTSKPLNLAWFRSQELAWSTVRISVCHLLSITRYWCVTPPLTGRGSSVDLKF